MWNTEINPSSGLYLQGEKFYITADRKEESCDAEIWGTLLRATKEVKSGVRDGSKRNSLPWQDTAPLEEHCTQDLCYLTWVQSPSILLDFFYLWIPQTVFLDFLF